jgi:TPR repeat protein
MVSQLIQTLTLLRTTEVSALRPPRMRALLVSFCVCIVLIGASCDSPVGVVAPVPGEPVTEEIISDGAWRFDGQPVRLENQGGGSYAFELKDNDETMQVKMKFLRLGKQLIADVSMESGAETVPYDLPCLLSVEKVNKFMLLCLSEDWLRDKAADEVSQGTIGSDRVIAFTGDELRDFLLHHISDHEAFGYPLHFEKWNTETLFRLQQKATEGGAIAQEKLALAYESGENTDVDRSQAFAWMMTAAQQGLGSAQNHLGEYFQRGIGTESDQESAIAWFNQAANQSYGPAFLNLGHVYEEGLGVTQDMTKAATWYERAAEQNIAQAYYRLGRFYENGDGVVKDVVQAMKNYQRAVDLDPNLAAGWRDLSRLYANSEDGQVRNTRQALGCALQAVELEKSSADYLDTLANAYAANKNWKKAVETEETAIDLSFDRDQKTLREETAKRYWVLMNDGTP